MGVTKFNMFLFLVFLFTCQKSVNGGKKNESITTSMNEEEYFEEYILDEEEEIIAEYDEIGWMDEVDWDEDEVNMDDVIEPGSVCSRLSPKEIFHSDIHPRILNILDEMSHFVEAVLDKLKTSLATLLPHLQQSPIGKLSEDELFDELRHFMLGTMKDVYDTVRVAWRELIRAHIYTATPPTNQPSPQTILTKLANVKDAQKEGEERLVASLKEFSITIKAVVFNSIYSVGMTLHLPNDTTEHDAAMYISKSLPKMAPNFLGTVMSSLIQYGSDPELYQKILTNPFRSITPITDQLHQTLESIIENGGNEEEMEDYWRKAIRTAYNHLKEEPLLVEDYHRIYQNEEYLKNLLLQLFASF